MNTLFKTLPKALAVVAGLLAIALAVPSLAQSDSLAMLRSLTKGEWTVTFRDGTPTRKICLRNGLELIQLRHPQANCRRFVVEDDVARVTVQYTCRGNGYGRTAVRRETGSLVQIESQGIASGGPFQFGAEARKTGTCQ
jgi:hypothetical protein